jgi:hypothetical protein
MFLKELESWLERGQIVPFLREKRPRKKCTPNIGADIEAVTGILLTYTKLAMATIEYKVAGEFPPELTFSERVAEVRDTKIINLFWLVPASCDFYMEIYNWDGQTVLSAHRLF